MHSFAYLSRFIQEFFEISARRARKTHDHFVPRFRNVWNYAQQLDDRRMVTLPHDSNLKMHRIINVEFAANTVVSINRSGGGMPESALMGCASLYHV